ncbi:MAG: GDSL-type esterase/lipase family protein [Bacteroidota bacterium]|nr:GDSL-type esterase/lipase family protein [Bacteroidota bacterium]MDP3145452.1 GDSL-type esterase/lipase family protein [Bacteroidota bacterium]
MHKPQQSLIFVILIFLVLGLLSFTFPKDGIIISSSLKLEFPSFNTLFEEKTKEKEVSKIISSLNEIDTTFAINDTLAAPTATTLNKTEKDSTVKLITSIQTTNKSALHNFFNALTELKTNPKAIRVLHYGDSQIEGDRITDYLRLKLQGQFGGHGPGLISLMPIAPSVINKINIGPGWDRYNVFTSKDKRVPHSNYGVLASFNRFSNYKKVNDSSSLVTSSITITTTKLGGSNALAYKKLKLFYGGAQTKTWCEFYDGPALIAADSLDEGGSFRIKEYNVGNGSNTHQLKFTGKDSPDFYAVSLESETGVLVDNIALRGSSGTFFHQINNGQLKQFYDYLNVKLIILQFGGNATPSIKDEKMSANYASYLRSQISIIKKAAPNASILFIGPADMSVKNGTEYETYPLLETTRNEIKRVVLESGCAFFDMYDCMGGKNSMPVWVDQKLAATDYIHFSPQGARKMATLLYSALINDYNSYLKSKK